MYKLHLILKYLRKRRIAWVSLIAVMLCTAMVIVVISVMGGWLRMFRESYHGIGGDIVVTRTSLAGFPHYQEMIDQIRKLPGVTGAVPALRTFGLINVWGQIPDGVQVVGYPLEDMDRDGSHVSKFRESLYRQYQYPREVLADPQASAEDKAAAKAELSSPATFKKPLPDDAYRSQFPKSKTVDPTTFPGMIVGSGVVGIRKNDKGQTEGREFLLSAWANLTVLGMNADSARLDVGNKTERKYWLVDDSRTKIWQFDQNTVYVPFDVLQKDLKMEQYEATDAETNQKFIVPARTNDIQIGAAPGTDLVALARQVEGIVDSVLKKHDIVFNRDPVRSNAWFDTQPTAKFLQAVEHEIVLTTLLFAIISVVAIFLIFCIFYMIVVEKTRDIGIIKSVGATSAGVAQIFLGYGLAIGIVGSGLGLLASYLIVTNINELHGWLSRRMGVTIWDAETYAFDTIPNTLNMKHVGIIIGVAIFASLLGALVPAIRAARMNPVEALRWE